MKVCHCINKGYACRDCFQNEIGIHEIPKPLTADDIDKTIKILRELPDFDQANPMNQFIDIRDGVVIPVKKYTEAELRAHLRTLAKSIASDDEPICPVSDCDGSNCEDGDCLDRIIDYAIQHPTEE